MFKSESLQLKVQEDKVTPNVFNALKYPEASNNSFRIDELHFLVAALLSQPVKPLEVCLVHPV